MDFDELRGALSRAADKVSGRLDRKAVNALLKTRSRQMAGFDAEKAREAYDIPEGYEPMTAIAVGYPGDPSGLPEKLRQAEKAKRDRRILSETLFTGRWGERIDI